MRTLRGIRSDVRRYGRITPVLFPARLLPLTGALFRFVIPEFVSPLTRKMGVAMVPFRRLLSAGCGWWSGPGNAILRNRKLPGSA
jgi:hypothetical protein